MTKSPFLAWAAVFVYMAVIFWLSHQSIPLEISIPGVALDFAAHAAEFALLSLLVGHACLITPSTLVRGHAFHVAVITVALFGLSDELHQALIPGRACEFVDWAADVTGAVLAQVSLWSRE